jgi:hypothetical protein
VLLMPTINGLRFPGEHGDGSQLIRSCLATGNGDKRNVWIELRTPKLRASDSRCAIVGASAVTGMKSSPNFKQRGLGQFRHSGLVPGKRGFGGAEKAGDLGRRLAFNVHG